MARKTLSGNAQVVSGRGGAEGATRKIRNSVVSWCNGRVALALSVIFVGMVAVDAVPAASASASASLGPASYSIGGHVFGSSATITTSGTTTTTGSRSGQVAGRSSATRPRSGGKVGASTTTKTTTSKTSGTTNTTSGTTATTVAPVVIAAPTTTTAPPVVVSSGPQPYGQPAGSWNLNFDSEFNGSGLDTSQWSTGWFGSGITSPVNSYEVQCYDPNQVSVGGGSLTLTAIARSESCGGVTRPFASGIVTTNGTYNFTYGYMEARIWLPGSGSISDWPAFWADGQNWPTTGEIDVMEGLGGAACAHFHYSGGGPGTCASGGFGGGWHTFAADWEPGSITYYYDGAPVWSTTSGVTSAPMYLILNLALNSGDGPASMAVDYVRVWQH